MARLIFDAKEVRKLYEHAKAAPEQSASFEHLTSPSYLKDGEIMPASGVMRPNQADPKKIPAHLILVKDLGVYLMSSGLPHLPGSGEEKSPNGTPFRPMRHVVFADGLGPEADYYDISAVSGDDFAEAIPLEFFREAMESNAKTFSVQLSEKNIRISFDARAREPERPKVDPAWLGHIEKQVPEGAKTVWAAGGVTYRGAVVGIDQRVVAQYDAGSKLLVLHEKAHLSREARLGEVLRLRYREKGKCRVERAGGREI